MRKGFWMMAFVAVLSSGAATAFAMDGVALRNLEDERSEEMLSSSVVSIGGDYKPMPVFVSSVKGHVASVEVTIVDQRSTFRPRLLGILYPDMFYGDDVKSHIRSHPVVRWSIDVDCRDGGLTFRSSDFADSITGPAMFRKPSSGKMSDAFPRMAGSQFRAVACRGTTIPS